MNPGSRPPREPSLAVTRWYVGARLANLALGLWLCASVFLWQHFDTSRRNTWVVGALICASALLGLRVSAARWVTGALAGWLFASTLLLIRPLAIETLWNNSLVAVAVFALTLVARRG